MDTRLDPDKAQITIALALVENGLMVIMWLVGFTKLKNIVVLICWKVKCGGSQS
jgi:hypothetical protein